MLRAIRSRRLKSSSPKTKPLKSGVIMLSSRSQIWLAIPISNLSMSDSRTASYFKPQKQIKSMFFQLILLNFRPELKWRPEKRFWCFQKKWLSSTAAEWKMTIEHFMKGALVDFAEFFWWLNNYWLEQTNKQTNINVRQKRGLTPCLPKYSTELLLLNHNSSYLNPLRVNKVDFPESYI